MQWLALILHSKMVVGYNMPSWSFHDLSLLHGFTSGTSISSHSQTTCMLCMAMGFGPPTWRSGPPNQKTFFTEHIGAGVLQYTWLMMLLHLSAVDMCKYVSVLPGYVMLLMSVLVPVTLPLMMYKACMNILWCIQNLLVLDRLGPSDFLCASPAAVNDLSVCF